MARAKKSGSPEDGVTEGAAGEDRATDEAGTQPEVAPEVALVEPDRPEPAANVRTDGPGVTAASSGAPAGARRRGGFFGTFLGGVAAAALGFGASLYLFPNGWKPAAPSAQEIALLGSVKTQGDDIGLLKKRVDDLAAAAAASTEAAKTELGSHLDGLESEIEALRQDVAAVVARSDDLDGRLQTLEKRPVAGGAASASALDAFAREMEDLRRLVTEQSSKSSGVTAEITAAAEQAAARIKAAEEEAARLKAEAEAAGRAERARAGLSRLQAALESGASLDSALADLASSGIEVPQALREQVQGIPSMAALRASFPDAARAALTLSLKETAGDSTWSRFRAFLRSQTGERSLTPRAGDDPDAVLSRAEAALGAGDLAAAVAELQGLPEGGRARMAEWIGMAERRMAAVSAVAELAAALK